MAELDKFKRLTNPRQVEDYSLAADLVALHEEIHTPEELAEFARQSDIRVQCVINARQRRDEIIYNVLLDNATAP